MDLVPKEFKKKGDIISPGAPNSNNAPPNRLGALGSVKLSNLAKSGFNYLKFGIIGGFVLLILSLGSWGGIKIYLNSVRSNIEDLKKQEAEIFSSQDKETAEKIADLEKRANLAQEFLKAHIYSSEILNSIAALTLPKVKWDTYTLSVKEREVILKGRAADYSVLAKQLFTLEQSSYSNVTVSGIALDKDGTVTFGVNFNFDPKILQKP